MKNLIPLPSGKIINLDLVAYVVPQGLYKSEKAEDARLIVVFSAIAANAKQAVPLRSELNAEDSESFLQALAGLGVTVGDTRKGLTRQIE